MKLFPIYGLIALVFGFSAAIATEPSSIRSSVKGGRPTAEEVAKAVQESFAAEAAMHPVPTQEQAVRKLQDELAQAFESRATAQRVTNPKSRAAAIKPIADEIKHLQAKIAETRKEYIPQVPQRRLTQLDLTKLKKGTVGRVYEGFQCLSIVDEKRFIGRLVSRSRSVTIPSDNRGGLTSVRTGSDFEVYFLVSGLDTTKLQEGLGSEEVFNAVVTGQYRYTSASGASRTIPVLEVFDPEKPFK